MAMALTEGCEPHSVHPSIGFLHWAIIHGLGGLPAFGSYVGDDDTLSIDIPIKNTSVAVAHGPNSVSMGRRLMLL